MREKLLKLIWGPRLFRDLLLLLALLPPVYLLFSTAFRSVPDWIWGGWLAFGLVNFLFLSMLVALWVVIRNHFGSKVPMSAWLQLLIAGLAFVMWVGVIPLELKVHTELGTPMIMPSFCNTEEAIGDTKLCRGRDYGAFGQAEAWYYGEGIPTAAQCARYATGTAAEPMLKESCRIEDVSDWSSTDCSEFNIANSYNCFVCIEQPVSTGLIRSLLAYDKNCKSGLFLYSINHELKGVL